MSREPLTWFSAALFFRSRHASGKDGLWEERIILISASDQQEAEAQAATIGAREKTSFDVSPDDHVTWEFVCVERVQTIDAGLLTSGVEVFSRFLRPTEATSILEPFD